MLLTHSDNKKTFYQEYGDPSNKAMILLHGIGADHNMWKLQVQVFAEKGFYVLVPDMFGHGNSSRVDSLELKDWQQQINDLAEEKNLSKFILVGVSMGGVIAQSYVVNHPDKVNALILSDTFAEVSNLKEKLPAFSHLAGLHIYKLLGHKALAKSMKSTYNAPYAKEAREYFAEVSKSADFDQLILARKAINKIDVLDQLESLNIPVLVMVGDKFGDWFIDINRKISNSIKGSQFKVLNNAMDPSNLVNPVDFNSEVLAFLDEL
jgi:pimeloyl-ACP methyl ester carboxylesterase